MGNPINSAEEFVSKICKRSFLSLWGFPNPKRRDKNEKELCDFIVICDPDIIIFSVKNIKRKNTRNIEIDWGKWQKKAIDDSVNQISGAIRVLQKNNQITDKDGNTINFPSLDSRKYHCVAVAFGGERKFPMYDSKTKMGNYVHVMDEMAFQILLKTLDTISDFVDYLNKKEQCLKNSKITIIGGEEELLPYYINYRNFPDGSIFIADGIWDEFSRGGIYRDKLEEDKKSYYWDNIIEFFSVSDGWKGAPLTEREKALRIMARETRLNRRLLAKNLVDFQELNKNKSKVARVIGSEDKVAYVFTIFDDKTEEYRKNYLMNHCYSVIGLYPDIRNVIGLNFKMNDQGPTDLLLIQAQDGEWTDETYEKSKYCREVLGCFKQFKPKLVQEKQYPTLT